MKKIILSLFVLSTCLVACGPSAEELAVQAKKNNYGPNSDYHTTMIGNCEYVTDYNGHVISHKGDCKNPIHIYNKLDSIPAY